METYCEELKQILQDELQIHTDLVKTAEEMNVAIKEKNVSKVQRLTSQYDICIGRIEQLEIKRLEICDTIAKHVKPTQRHMNLQNIIVFLPEEHHAPLDEMRKALKTKLHDLSRVNTSNQILLHESLTAIGKNFELINESHNKLAGYGGNGTLNTKSVRKNIVNHIA